MSANTSIKEGGKGRAFGPVMALMVQGSDGKYYPWYLESERQLGYKSIDKNGVYQAKKDGVYGWSSVSVNVSQNEGVTGRDPDTGEEVYVHPDPEGELVKDVLPTEIRVITPPAKTTYNDGETIDYSGIVVHAYSATGQDMGEVPFGELIFTQKLAIYDPTKTEYMAKSGLATLPLEQPIKYSRSFKISGEIKKYGNTYVVTQEYICEDGICIIYQNSSNRFGYSIGRKDDKGQYIYKRCVKHTTADGREIIDKNETFSRDITHPEFTHENKTVYIAYAENARMFYDGSYLQGPLSYSFLTCDEYIPTESMGQQISLRAAWTALYGEQVGGIPIPVQWPRTGDGAILETSFNINVTGGD